MNARDILVKIKENVGNEEKVFDRDKAARIIAEKKPEYAIAGLEGDWHWTSGTIYENDKPVYDESTFLASIWATPVLEIDGTPIECYVMESETDWNESTKWPESALAILKGKENDE